MEQARVKRKPKYGVTQLNPSKLRQENAKLTGKFRTLNEDYSHYKSTVRDVVSDETYNKIIARLRGDSDGE